MWPIKCCLALVLVCAVAVVCAVEVKFTNLVCVVRNRRVAAFDKCHLKALRRNVAELSFKVRSLIGPIKGIQLSLEFFKWSNGWTEVMRRLDVDVCEFLSLRSRRRNPMMQAFTSLFMNNSNMNHSCPYDEFFVENLLPRNPAILLPFPRGHYMYKVSIGLAKLQTVPNTVVVIKICFKTLE